MEVHNPTSADTRAHHDHFRMFLTTIIHRNASMELSSFVFLCVFLNPYSPK